jgi:hypothetical protein
VDVLRHVGEEDLAGTGDLHQLGALATDGLLDHPRHSPGPGVLERYLPLIGDHRAELRLDRHVRQLDLQQLGVLQRERLARLGLRELRERLLYRHRFPSW